MKRFVLAGLCLSALTWMACDKGSGNSAPSEPASKPASSAASGSTTSEGPTKVPGALSVAEADVAVNEDPDGHDGKPMKVSGVVQKIMKQTAGPAGKRSATYALLITSSVDEKRPVVYCGVGKEEPTTKEGASVAAEGKVRLDKMRAKDGGAVYSIELRDCKVL